ncbi:3-hydroxyisobutyrate dehydrogenase-like beta-hydroxyacid dehydrogenase [Pseudomonas sp. TE3786]
MKLQHVTLIGFGEAGGILGHDLVARGVQVHAYDHAIHHPARREQLLAKAGQADVQLFDSAAAAVAHAQLVISAVTAASALQVARDITPYLHCGQVFMDINSVAPATKQAAAEALEVVGVAYLDAAVMAPVPPKRIATPMLLGGSRALEWQALLAGVGFDSKVVGAEVGVASAIKMCRSIMIKGLEALTTECLSTARQYAAEALVLDSLHRSFPSMGWDAQQPHYLISRVAEHGLRRAEEMLEVAKTVADVGLQPSMSTAIAHTQRALVDAMAAGGISYREPFIWQALVDQLYPSY